MTASLHKIIKMMAAIWSAMGSAQATSPPRVELPPLAKLIGQLRNDTKLRASFCLNPRSVFEATGIDATAYNLPERLDEDEVQRFLNDWTAATGPAVGSHHATATMLASEDRSEGGERPVPPPAPPAPLYGPPPGRLTDQPKTSDRLPMYQPSEDSVSGESLHPSPSPRRPPSPGPVHSTLYGPPPGNRNTR